MKRHYPKLTPWGTNTKITKAADVSTITQARFIFTGDSGHVLGYVLADSAEEAKAEADKRWPTWIQFIRKEPR